MTDKELLQQALDALINAKGYIFHNVLNDSENRYDIAIEAIKARLAQPEPEPVEYDVNGATVYIKPPLYTAPPKKEWVGITDEEIMDACSAVWASHPIEVGNVVQDLLKEKNT